MPASRRCSELAPEGMKYLYVGATAGEADRTRRRSRRSGSGWAGSSAMPVRQTGTAARRFRLRRTARGSTARSRCWRCWLGSCPPDAVEAAGGDGARPVHSRADLRLRAGAAGRPGGGGLAGAAAAGVLRPAARTGSLLRAGAARKRCTKPGTLFGLVHCADRTCAMSLSTNVRQIDCKSAARSARRARPRLRRIPREQA